VQSRCTHIESIPRERVESLLAAVDPVAAAELTDPR
jgi:hypothetical protein